MVTSVTWDTTGGAVEGGGGSGAEAVRAAQEGAREGHVEVTHSGNHLLTSFLRPAPSSWPLLSWSTQLLRMFFRQQDEIRRLKEELAQKDIRIRQLQLELKNLRNSPKNC